LSSSDRDIPAFQRGDDVYTALLFAHLGLNPLDVVPNFGAFVDFRRRGVLRDV